MVETARFIAALVVALAGAGFGCASDPDDGDEAEAKTSAIIGNDIANHEHPEVVQLSVGGVCTGTLIGRRTVLTARHCLEGLIGGGGKCVGAALVDLTGGGGHSATRVAFDRCVQPKLGWVRYWGNDLGLIRLAEPVTGVRPAIMAHEDPRRNGFTAYGYGSFGVTGLGSQCKSISDGNKRKITYRGSVSALIGQMTCSGDSGGPHFVEGTNVLAGITSGGALRVEGTATVWSYAHELDKYVREFERE